MLNYSCDSDLGVRLRKVHALRKPARHRPLGGGKFFDIVRLPGGRFKTKLVFMDSRPLIRSLPLTHSPPNDGELR